MHRRCMKQIQWQERNQALEDRNSWLHYQAVGVVK
jgi:hypothetical protein